MPRSLSLAVLLSLFVGIPTDATPADFVLVDANDQPIGKILAFQDRQTAQVTLEVEGRPVLLTFEPTFEPVQLEGTDHWVYFSNDDCSGQAYLFVPSDSRPVPEVVAVGSSLELFVATGEPIVPDAVRRSYMMPDGICRSTDHTQQSFPAHRFVTGFEAPYRIEAVAAPAAPIATVLSVPAVHPVGLAFLALALLAGGVAVIARHTT